MVLVPVGDENALELVLVLEHVGVVGQHEVDAGLVVVREHQARVDEQHVVAVLDRRHVLADAVEATQRDDLEGGFLLCHGCAGTPFVCAARGHRQFK